jgi:D-alanyl-D-alanine endopeptidase (penicillin-binding protein 7)
MILKLFAQLALASTMLQLFPVDAHDLEVAASLPLSEARPASTYSPITMPVAHLPVSKEMLPIPQKRDPRRLGIVTSAVSAIVIDRRSGAVLFEKNREAPRSIGSITKLMTAYVFLQTSPDLAAIVSLEPEDVRLGGIQHVKVGEPVSVRDLMYASLVSSDNSATAALVRLSKMPYGDFVAKMNETAAAIGMAKTQFVDPTGLSAKNTSVVMDVARLIDQTSTYEIIRDATTHATFVLTSSSGATYTLENTNDLLSSFVNRDPYQIVTAKTGYLPEAGYCLGAIFSREGDNEIIVVVLGAESDAGRFQDVKSLAVWTYDVYGWN